MYHSSTLRITPAAWLLRVGISICLGLQIPSAGYAETSRQSRAVKNPMIAIAADGSFVNGEGSLALDDVVTFVGPGNSLYTDTNKLIEWREEEIEAVKIVLRDVWARYPELLEQAAGASGKVFFCRTKMLIGGREHHSVPSVTNTVSGSIILADYAFKDLGQQLSTGFENSLHRMLVHELVHAADPGYRIAYSKAWVSFALPTISVLQKRQEGLSGNERFNAAAKALHETDWPSVYGCENLQEALAEYFSFFYFQKGLIRVKFVEEFAPHFINTTKEDRLYRKHFRSGALAYAQHRLNDAVAEFTAARDIDPGAALAPMHLMYCYSAKNDVEHALKYSEIALDCFETAGVPSSTWDLKETQGIRILLLSKVGRKAEAAALSQKLYDFKPMSDATLQKLEEDLNELLRKKTSSKKND